MLTFYINKILISIDIDLTLNLIHHLGLIIHKRRISVKTKITWTSKNVISRI
jgi:hypothetical protein